MISKDNPVLDKVIESAERRAFIAKKMEELKPLIESVIEATDRYDNTPSIANGSRKQDARDKLHKWIQETAQAILERWRMTPEEMEQALNEITMEV